MLLREVDRIRAEEFYAARGAGEASRIMRERIGKVQAAHPGREVVTLDDPPSGATIVAVHEPFPPIAWSVVPNPSFPPDRLIVATCPMGADEVAATFNVCHRALNDGRDLNAYLSPILRNMTNDVLGLLGFFR